MEPVTTYARVSNSTSTTIPSIEENTLHISSNNDGNYHISNPYDFVSEVSFNLSPSTLDCEVVTNKDLLEEIKKVNHRISECMTLILQLIAEKQNNSK